MTGRIDFTLDGEAVTAAPGETIWQVAAREGVDIPHLCYSTAATYRADGNCRVCMVEIEGERTLAASCLRAPTPGMAVKTGTERAETARKMVMELLLADQPARESAHDPRSELWRWAERMGQLDSRFPAREAPAPDPSHPAMAVNLDACIHCTRRVRACRESQVNDVIGMAYRGHGAKVVFDFGDPMGASTCVACGECVQACPTRALMPANLLDAAGVRVGFADRQVDSVCPYCGVGCQITYNIQDNHILSVDGREGPGNQGRLCVKGRFGFDYVSHPHRLTAPLIRRDDAPKDSHADIDPANPLAHFREATWEEALAAASAGFARVRAAEGSKGLAGFGSAKGSNEEAYLFQKLVRTGFGTNNVDHCTRLCHASSVAALLETIGSGAVTAPFTDALKADVILVIGANPTENHPVAATFFKNAAKRGATLIVCDPRGQALRKQATHMLRFTPAADVAMLNAMMHVIVEEELYDRQYIEAHTEGFDALKAHVGAFPPEKMAEVCGIDAETLRTVARKYAPRRARDHLLGHGHLAKRPRHRQRPLPDRAVADDRPDRPAGDGAAPLARPEQRAGRLGRRPHPDHVPRLPVGRGPRPEGQVRGILGRGARPQARAHGRRDHGTRSTTTSSRACTSWARTRRCRTPTRTMHAAPSPSSSTWWCRISSSPRRRSTPTWCCLPRPGPRRTAR